MEQQNPYASPTSQVMEPESTAPGQPAGRGVRLGAAILDTLLALAVMLPLQWFGGYFAAAVAAGKSGQTVPWTLQLLWGGISLAVFVAMQGWPLHESGQTWGKRALSIRIVDLAGEKPPFWRLLALRYFPLQIVVLIPVVGLIVALVNPLLIFRADRRCLHDHIAGTRVVIAD
ncbi:MAG: hypothetical protein BGP24_13450 [Lysobacterales bacterium 69-70]|nr:RDD family protein [Xanthomonadaceae bacterium]ODU31181.1 MAG: hypothetical protein ABS97_23210 [Xanthomonadaceae bacterium SCN 69-320]ODV22664.1 MAG: hypothetical protein ABT27_00965 [Xanthomonadaceae bacterium SCN 69-25]OJY98770.1 MAG: hypothetical protein BGP24_13450 [Xanthomonadales bacterium 69-70]